MQHTTDYPVRPPLALGLEAPVSGPGVVPIMATDGGELRPSVWTPHQEELIETELLPFQAGCRVFHTAFGRVVIHPGYALLHDANMVLLKRMPPGMAIPDVEKLVRPLFQSVGAGHLRFLVLDPVLAEQLKDSMLEAGYRRTCFVIMEVTGPSSRGSSPEVVLREADTLAAMAIIDKIEGELLREVPWNSRMIRSALRTRRRELSRNLDLKWYWGAWNGVPAGSIGLLRSGQGASIQEVATRPNLRGRSVASSMVLQLMDVARGLGHTHISLMTDEADWPQHLYGRLGFERVAHVISYLRDE